MRPPLLLALAAITSAGCASIDKTRGHHDVARLVMERSGQETFWDQGTPEDAEVAKRVRSLVEAGLTRERAVAIALVNNPALQSTYEELDVSQAEMVEAGLLENPTLSGSFGIPLSPGAVPELEAAIAQNFLGIFVLPLRRKIAGEQFNAAMLRVAHDTLGVVAEVTNAFIRLQLLEKELELERTVVAAFAAFAELSQRMHEAGNITDMALLERRGAWQQGLVGLARTEVEVLDAREHLNRLLGLWGENTEWKLAGALPELPEADEPLERLESTAITQRLDIAAARKQLELLVQAVGLARSTRFLGTIEVGVHAHRDADGPFLVGPTLSLELPIFNQRQGLIARLEALKRQAERRLTGLSVNARSEVRLAQARMRVARRVVAHYREVVLPLRGARLASTQLQYNAMQLGLDELLDSKREQLDSQREHARALAEYWSARADLERALGGRLGAARKAPPPAPSRPSEEEKAHDHP